MFETFRTPLSASCRLAWASTVAVSLALSACGGSPEDEATEASVAQALADAPASVALKIDWQGQKTGYWCGPASTRIALSSQLSSPPSQQTLATAEHTTINGTDDIRYVSTVLDSYLKTDVYTPRYISDPPTASQSAALKQALVATLSNGLPMVINIVSGWRPSFYPQGGTIYHYLAVVGYDQNGDRALIADPAAKGSGGSSWSKVPSTYYVTTKDLATWIGGKGYAATSLPIVTPPTADGGTATLPGTDGGTGDANPPGVGDGTDGGVAEIPEATSATGASVQGCSATGGEAFSMLALGLAAAFLATKRR